MPCGHQNGVDGIAGDPGQLIALEQAIGLGVTDDRLDGIAPDQLGLSGIPCVGGRLNITPPWL